MHGTHAKYEESSSISMYYQVSTLTHYIFVLVVQHPPIDNPTSTIQRTWVITALYRPTYTLAKLDPGENLFK